MAFELNLVLVFLLILAVVAIGAFILWGVKHAVLLAVNSVIGFFALYAVQFFILTELVINTWSVLLVAFLGLLGLIVVVLLHLFGFAF